MLALTVVCVIFINNNVIFKSCREKHIVLGHSVISLLKEVQCDKSRERKN